MYAPEQWGRSASGTIGVGEVSWPHAAAARGQIAKAEKLLER